MVWWVAPTTTRYMHWAIKDIWQFHGRSARQAQPRLIELDNSKCSVNATRSHIAFERMDTLERDITVLMMSY